MVANSKKLVAMTNTHNHFYLITVLDRFKLLKKFARATKRTLEWVIYNVLPGQGSCYQCLGPFSCLVCGLSDWWVGAELNSLIFKFFWSGKRDLVARRVVVQTFLFGWFFCS